MTKRMADQAMDDASPSRRGKEICGLSQCWCCVSCSPVTAGDDELGAPLRRAASTACSILASTSGESTTGSGRGSRATALGSGTSSS